MRQAALAIVSLILVLATAPSANAALHVVNQVNFSFQPADLTIDQGDTVRWVWSDGSHTVTNGTGAADVAAGTLFDATLNGGNSTFEYVFTTSGVYPYFCRPHESLGMKGVITVQDSTPVEATTWSRLKRIFESADR